MSFHRIKPILFNTEMVKAILDGKKTVTRRVIKPRNAIRAKKEGYKQGGYGLWIDPSTDNGDKQGHIKDYSISDMWSTWKWYIDHCAPYQIGDILYVRETWARLVTAKDGEMQSERYVYKATDTYPFGESGYIVKFRWHPSIHMPKEAARIWLKVTDVRVERLQDITEDDVCKEGAEPLIQCDREHATYNADGTLGDMCWNTDECSYCPFEKSYSELFGEMVWNSTIKKQDLDSYGWDANPWVFVVSFERIERIKL